MSVGIADNGARAVIEDRQRLMRICGQATEAELERAISQCSDVPEAEDVRIAEEGLVMIRGRIGGAGVPFNLGEATVTRAVVQLSGGPLGYAYLLGRVPGKARLAAIIDALGQSAQWRGRLEDTLVQPVTERHEAEKKKAREETEATRVNFFTLVRGED